MNDKDFEYSRKSILLSFLIIPLYLLFSLLLFCFYVLKFIQIRLFKKNNKTIRYNLMDKKEILFLRNKFDQIVKYNN